MFDERFEGWVADDFAAYDERKWRSNRFNLERRRVRARLVDLVTRAAANLPSEGLEVWSGLDHPSFFNGHAVSSQRVAWCRGSAQRASLMRANPSVEADRVERCHAHLGLEVDAEGVTLLLDVPADAAFDHAVAARARAEAEGLAAASQADFCAHELGGWRVSRRWRPLADPAAGGAPDEAATLEPHTAEVAAWLGALWPLFQASLWRTDNDPTGLAASLAAASSVERAAAPDAGFAADAAPVDSPAAAPAGATPQAADAPASRTAERDPPGQPRRPAPRPGPRPGPGPAPRRAAPHRPPPRPAGSRQPGPKAPWRARSRGPATIAPPGSGRDAKAEEEARLAAERAAAERASEERAAKALALLSAGSTRSGGASGRSATRGERGPAGAPRDSRSREGQAGRPGDRRGAGGGASARGHARGDRQPAGRREPRRGSGARPSPAGPRRPYEARPAVERATVAVGAEVELTAGLFSGKRGVVRAVSGNQAEVDVGGMQLKVRLTELREP